MQNSCCRTCRLPLAVIIMIACCFSGCRSQTWSMPSWKMPGSSFFSKREPDAATLAGKSGVPQLPESPAAKYTSENLVAGGRMPGTAVGGGTTPAGGFPAQTGLSAQGLAAKSNGYQTGPYQMSGATSAPGSQPAPNIGYNAPNPYSTASTGGANATMPGAGGQGAGAMNAGALGAGSRMPNPYGGTFGNATGTLAGGLQMPSNGLPPNTASTAPNPGAFPPIPGYPSTPAVAGVSYSEPSLGMLPAIPSLGTNASTAGSMGSAPQGITPQGIGAGIAPPPAPAMGAVAPAGSAEFGGATTLPGFAPGTTARSTAYNFGESSGATASPSTRPTFTLPPNSATNPNGSPVLR